MLVFFSHLKEEKYWIGLISMHVQHMMFQTKTNFSNCSAKVSPVLDLKVFCEKSVCNGYKQTSYKKTYIQIKDYYLFFENHKSKFSPTAELEPKTGQGTYG